MIRACSQPRVWSILLFSAGKWLRSWRLALVATHITPTRASLAEFRSAPGGVYWSFLTFHSYSWRVVVPGCWFSSSHLPAGKGEGMRPGIRHDVWSWVMGFQDGTAGSGNRLQCPASMVQKALVTSAPPRRTGIMGKRRSGAAIALMCKVRCRSGGASWRCPKTLSVSAGNPPTPRGDGPVILHVRLGQQGDSVASRAYQIQPGW
jgi:hypothetical protein